MDNVEHLFNDGCMWEGGEWKIVLNHTCSEWGGGKPCEHCYDIKENIKHRSDGHKIVEKVWVCPRVVICYNEGGYNSTGICLDCLLEAEKSITEQP